MPTKEEKIAIIIYFFKFKNIDDATIRLNEVVILRNQKGKQKKDVSLELRKHPEIIIDLVYDKILTKKGNFIFKWMYRPPLCYSANFSILLMEIGKSFNHSCKVINCYPNYLNGGEHQVVQDLTSKVFRDAFIYNSKYNLLTGKWEPTPPEFMINVPLNQINPVK